MKWVRFHHPDICPALVRRRITESLIDLFEAYADLLAHRYWAVLGGRVSRTAYHCAVYRLRKAGLDVRPGHGLNRTQIDLVDPERRPEQNPERHWCRRWGGYWYMLVYDVPETEREYRNALRGFLNKMRMGMLQRSVWVSPNDVRPEYDDLVKAARVDTVAFLFEATTVLGMDPQTVVSRAWNFESLNRLQMWYMDVAERNMIAMDAGDLDAEAIAELAGEEMDAYVTVMRRDPLLPRELWSQDYLGPRVYATHCDFVQRTRRNWLKRLG